ncbi:TerC family protein [Piscinibacter terrae]|uniref:TerC family protein n=1 Tax=Piscinibacter terrae TaxID=2496871 RepID=A0A3N7HT87_9BURK|nr:TerC family protein [Albitalea terrae]RQP24486.1 TerC family protein [Albitalea terrae]
MDFTSAAFWAALGSIILTNVVLSGDNAVVIALAARSLPPQQQKKAIFWGSAAAIVLRIVLTLVAVQLLQQPYLKIVGAVLLFWIGVQLLLEEEDEIEDGKAPEQKSMMSAVRTILIADLVMSLDNVLAVAAAAKDSVTLLVLGLGISIPLIIFGSTLLLKLMERFPIIITAGGALLGYLAGEMLVTDPAVKTWLGAEVSHTVANIAGGIGAAAVVAIGLLWRRRAKGGATT